VRHLLPQCEHGLQHEITGGSPGVSSGRERLRKWPRLVGLTACFQGGYHKWKETPHDGLTRVASTAGYGGETGTARQFILSVTWADRTVERTVDKMLAGRCGDTEGGGEGFVACGGKVARQAP
jgi:hypothetical protein